MYKYEPEHQDPLIELESNLNIYRDLINNLMDYDGMELENYLSSRDGIEWALSQLDRRVDAQTMAEVEYLDRQLRDNAERVIALMDPHYLRAMQREIPPAHWWWHLDQELSEQVFITQGQLLKAAVSRGEVTGACTPFN